MPKEDASGALVRRPFHGHVTRFERTGANGGFARYGLTIEPWLAFLGKRQDSYIFQDKSVFEIVDELLGDWQGQGALVPAWRWDVADRAAYPKRSYTVQFEETDLDFLRRILADEGGGAVRLGSAYRAPACRFIGACGS